MCVSQAANVTSAFPGSPGNISVRAWLNSGMAQSTGELTVYTTSWCPFCARLVADLDRAGIEFTDVDVEADRAAAALVERLNGGNRTVPTVVFPDGSSLTNPPVSQVAARLAR